MLRASISGDLLLQRADGRLECRQLALRPIPPEAQGLKLALQVASPCLPRLFRGDLTGERGEHEKMMQIGTLLTVLLPTVRSESNAGEIGPSQRQDPSVPCRVMTWEGR